VRSRDGTVIAFDRSGRGPPLILVAGALGQRKAPYAQQVAALLSPHFSVFNYDRRGRGDSGDTSPYTVEREIEDLDALIAEAGGSAYVFGASSGAALALEAAARGSAISRLAVFEPPYMVDPTLHMPAPDRMERVDELLSAGRRGDAVEYFFIAVIGVPADIVARMRKAPSWASFEDIAHTLYYDLVIMSDFSLPRQLLETVNVPTLVIGGEESDPRLRKAVQAVAEVLPNAQLRMLEGQAHGVEPSVLAPVLTDFFVSREPLKRPRAR